MIPGRVPGPAIELDQVSVSEGRQVLFDPVSCRFSAGHWHAILGPNGSGKSTLLKSLLGLKNHKGRIRILRQTTASLWPRRARIGYMPQLVPFDASLPISLRDYLVMSRHKKPVFLNRDLDDSECNALRQLRLYDKLDRRLGDLSGGERQRLMLLCALAQQPELLILDEPMSGLDATGRDESIELLTRFRDAGGTILMVEHDWSLVRAHCDQVYWLDGDIKASGPCERFEEVITPMTQVAL